MGTNSKTTHQSYVVAPTHPPIPPPPADPSAPPDNPAATDALPPDPAPHHQQKQPLDAELISPDLNPPDPTDGVAHAIVGDLTNDPNVSAVAPHEPVEGDLPAPLDSAAGLPDTSDAGADTSAVTSTDETAPTDELLPLTPVPDTPEPGLAHGYPVLVGGGDLCASTATLVTYLDADGPRSVLHAVVNEAAEAKLLDSLHLSGTELVAVQVEQTVDKRHTLDEANNLAETMIAAAKSVNYHLAKGDLTTDDIPETTQAKILAASTLLTQTQTQSHATPVDPAASAMIQHYEQHLEAIGAAAATATPVSTVTPYLQPTTVTVTTHVPAAAAGAPIDGALPAAGRDATRIKPTINDDTGEASWDGVSRHTNVNGKEYTIDLGDGYSAVYRAYAENDPKHTELSLRGRLEIIAPAGEGHGPELVRRLGQLHLANKPMTAVEGEWSYLSANITAQDLAQHPAVIEAMAVGGHIDDMVRQELFHERAHLALGLDDTQLTHFAKQLQLDATTQALPRKVTVLRDALATATGYKTGQALAASPGYDPTPQRTAGWLSWNRFDVGNQAAKLTTALQGKAFEHRLGQGSLKSMLTTGVLASTERRVLMGTATNLGQSEAKDKHTGGASSVFLRLRPAHLADGPALVWDDPQRLLRRADYYGANDDTYGKINNPHATRDPFKIADFDAPNNEVMFSDGIDLLGIHAPTRILCSSVAERDEIRALLAAKGITTLAGKPINDVITWEPA